MASILESMPKGPAEVSATLAAAERVAERVLAAAEVDGRGRIILDLLGKGLSLADVFGITPQEREAVLGCAIRAIGFGDCAKARDLLAGLVRLEPLDRRAVYALGVALQGCGAFEEAGRTHIHAIALDATDPQGYLRLGECLLANGEREPARGCFEAAKAMAGAKAEAPAVRAHADRMLAALGAPPAGRA